MTTNIATKRAVGYFRVSTPGQAGELHSSLDTQNAHFAEFCSRNSLSPVATYTDILTGRRDDRKEYLQLVNFVVNGGADVIVVQFLDRFGRNPREILRRYWDLEERGVAVVATDEDIREELMLLIKAGIAGAESRRNSERMRANMARSVSKGVHAARSPYGLRRNRALEGDRVSVTWELDPVEAPLVREMYRLAVEQNMGYKAIGDRLTGAGNRARGGGPFRSFTIQSVLTNPAIRSSLTYGRKPRKGNPNPQLVEVPDFFPRILSDEEWTRLQERLSIRRESARGQTHSSPYLLSGIAKCGHCGGPLAGRMGARKQSNPDERYRSYRCARAGTSKESCAFANGHTANKLETAVLEYLGQFSDPKKVREFLNNAEQKDTKHRESELARTRKRLKELETGLLNDLERLDRRVITEDEFNLRNDARRQEKTDLEPRESELAQWVEQVRSSEAQIERLPEAIGSFLEDFQGMDIRWQKAQLQTLLRAAYIYRDGRIELEFRG